MRIDQRIADRFVAITTDIYTHFSFRNCLLQVAITLSTLAVVDGLAALAQHFAS